MNGNRQKQVISSSGKAVEQANAMPRHETRDERYPGTFFRVPGVPMPGKTTWSLAK